MKRLNLFFTGLFIAAIVLFTSPLFAVGIGGFLTLGSGSYDWSYTNAYGEIYDPYYGWTEGDIDDWDESTGMSKVGIGFILDTNVARDSVFNYRLQISISSMSFEGDSEDDSDIDATEFFVYNTFGFGVARTDKIRFWLGPQIGVGFVSGEFSFEGSDELDTNEIFLVGANIGVAAGLNIHLTQLLTLAMDTGLRSNSLAGAAEISAENGSLEADVTASGMEFFFNIGLLFRFGDQYSGYTASSSSSDDDIDLDIE